jgi:putative transport protein
MSSASPEHAEVLVKVTGEGAREVDDPELLSVPIEGVDAYVTNKAVDGKTLAELAQLPTSRGVFLRKITRGATATAIPILPNTKIYRGDILTIVGRTQDTSATAKMLGVADRPTDVADVAFIGAGIAVGALIGALVWKSSWRSTHLSYRAGGALIAGLVLGWRLRSTPLFGRIPSSTVWFMNSGRFEYLHRHCRYSPRAQDSSTGSARKALVSSFGQLPPLCLSSSACMLASTFPIPRCDHLLGILSGARTTTASLGGL